MEQESRRDTLAAALDKASATAEPASETETPAAAVEAAEPPKAEAQTENVPRETSEAPTKAERARRTDGTFAKEAAKPKEAAPANPPVAARQPRKYPSTWKPEYKPTWDALDADEKYRGALDEVERREQDYFKSIEQYKSDAGFAASLKKVIAPYEATLRGVGARPEQAIAGLLNSDHVLRHGSPQQKQQAFRALVQSYGLDPSWAAQGEQQPQLDPNLAHLQRQLAQVQQQNQQIHSTFQRQLLDQANHEIEAFKKDAPHFEDVRGAMARLIQAGLASNVRDAYDKAIYADPVIRGKVLAEQQAKAEAERKQKAQQATQAAKAAAVQVKGAPTGDSRSNAGKPKDRRALLEQALADAS